MVEGSNDSVSATRKSESVCLPSKSWSFASSWEIDTTAFTILSDTLSASSGLEPVETANKHKIDAESVWAVYKPPAFIRRDMLLRVPNFDRVYSERVGRAEALGEPSLAELNSTRQVGTFLQNVRLMSDGGWPGGKGNSTD